MRDERNRSGGTARDAEAATSDGKSRSASEPTSVDGSEEGAGHNQRTTAEAERARRLAREAAQREHPDLVSSHKRETGAHGLHAADVPELRRPLEDDASADLAEHEGSWPEDSDRP